MNHWQMILLAYALTGAALTLEVALLRRRRRNAWLSVATDGVEIASDPVQTRTGAAL
jgi:hypothetical protein